MYASIDEQMDSSVTTIDNIMTSTLMPRNMSYNAIITPGEASESEEDEEPEEMRQRRVSFSQMSPRTRRTSEMSQSQRSTFSDDNSIGDTNKYNTLLHKKLRERNQELKRELSELACGPYIMATKEVTNITKQLIQSQKMVQNVSASLRKVSKELKSLGETIAAIKNDKNLLLNEFMVKPAEEPQEMQPNIPNTNQV